MSTCNPASTIINKFQYAMISIINDNDDDDDDDNDNNFKTYDIEFEILTNRSKSLLTFISDV